MGKIKCKFCGWSWDANDGGDDKYMCHICNNDNSADYINESKKKLFMPRNIESRYEQWNKEQPIIDGVRINQYDSEGNKTGYWEEYEDGKLSAKGNYVNGEMNDYWEVYYGNGKLYAKGNYINGLKQGYWEFYYSNGKFAYKGKWDNGVYIDNIYESEQPKKKKLFVPKGLSNDENNRFLKLNKNQPIKIINGKEIRINQYDLDGREQGYWEEYYDNEQLWRKGRYKNGKMEGNWEEYYDDGNLWYKGSYVNGGREGYWEYYYNGELNSKGSYVNGGREGYWEYYYSNGNLKSKGSYINGKPDGYWEYYHLNGELSTKSNYKNGEKVENIGESEQPKKKLFVPRDVDKRYDDLIKNMITTNDDLGEYQKRRDAYKDLFNTLDPLIMTLPKNDLIGFVKANPFWVNSIDKVEHLFKKLSFNENKDISENHIGKHFSEHFYTSPEMDYYEKKLKAPKSNYGKIDTYIFIGSDEFVETKNGGYKKVFDIERLMKVSSDNWRDVSDYGFSSLIKQMKTRATANNKQLFKISAYKGLLDEYNHKTGHEIPEFILSAIDEKKERV